MSWVFISIIGITIAQLVICRGLRWMGLCFLITLIARLFFLGRLIGATSKVKSIVIAEGFSVGMLVLFNILSKYPTNWVALVLYALISGICCLIMLIDDTFYLYVTEDVDDTNKEED